MQSEQIDQIATALAAAQAEMSNAPLTKQNPHFRSKYADLASVRDATVPALSKHGLAIMQTTDMDGDGGMLLKTSLLHTSGQWVASVCPLNRNVKPQEMGSQLTYFRRYSWQAICGISADEDDDANTAQAAAKNGNDAAPRGKRTMVEISAAAKTKTDVYEGAVADLPQIESLAALERYKREVLTPEVMSRMGSGQYLIEEIVARRESELSQPDDDEPDPADEDRMDYVRHCLAVIDEAKGRTQLADWWKAQSGRRRELALTKEQLAQLKRVVEEKRDTLPGGRTDQAYATMHAPQAE